MKKYQVVFLFVFLAGCSASPTVHPSITQTVSPTPSPFVTNTPFLLPTITLIPPTMTLPPVLQPVEAETLIFDLLNNNGNCLFPCWFGLKPGESDFQSSKAFVEQFSSLALSSRFYDDVGGVFWRIDTEGFFLNIIMDFTYDRKLVDKVESLRVTIDVTQSTNDGGFETAWENPINNKFLGRYRMPQVLIDHGEPEQILVFANEGWRYFELILDYSSRGFAVWYSAPLESSNDMFVGCPSKFFFKLYSWMNEEHYAWAEGITGNSDDYEINSLNRDFFLLEDSTLLTVGEFYKNFSSLQNSDCIETPKNIWPGP